MLNKLRKAGQDAVDSAKSAAQATADGVKSAVSVEANVDRALSLMERAAIQTAQRKGVKRFRIGTRVDLGIADISIEVEYETAELLEVIAVDTK